MITFENMPAAIAALPRDSRGYPFPWFVAERAGMERDFRVACAGKKQRALCEGLCWVCGGELHQKFPAVCVIGPMCAINRTTSEPPCHHECAVFSAINCPFLSMPKAQRREANMPCGGTIAGIPIMRNPGVACLWHLGPLGISLFGDGRGGILIDIGEPVRVQWFAEGREATRAEVMASIESGMPILMDEAKRESQDAVDELNRRSEQFKKWLPKR